MICISYFAFECLFKVLGLGLKTYFKDKYNVFDLGITSIICLVVTLLSWLDFFISEDLSFISVLRIMRMLRILHLVENNLSFEILQDATFKLIPYMFGYSILIFFYLFINLLLNLKLYSGKIRYDRFGELD